MGLSLPILGLRLHTPGVMTDYGALTAYSWDNDSLLMGLRLPTPGVMTAYYWSYDCLLLGLRLPTPGGMTVYSRGYDFPNSESITAYSYELDFPLLRLRLSTHGVKTAYTWSYDCLLLELQLLTPVGMTVHSWVYDFLPMGEQLPTPRSMTPHSWELNLSLLGEHYLYFWGTTAHCLGYDCQLLRLQLLTDLVRMLCVLCVSNKLPLARTQALILHGTEATANRHCAELQSNNNALPSPDTATYIQNTYIHTYIHTYMLYQG